MIYLNNSATSFPKPDCVVRAVEEALLSPLYDAGRGSVCGEDVTAVRRRAIAELLGVRDERVFFTSGATESFNMLLRGLLMAGKKICISCYEHNALAEPLDAELAERLARPFLTVRAERLIIRSIFGDSFIRVGVPERDAPEVKMLEEYINAQA